jgi:hypothetical protein
MDINNNIYAGDANTDNDANLKKYEIIKYINNIYIKKGIVPNMIDYIIKIAKLNNVKFSIIKRFLSCINSEVVNFVISDDILYEFGILTRKSDSIRNITAIRRFFENNNILNGIDYRESLIPDGKTNRLIKFFLNGSGVAKCCLKKRQWLNASSEFSILISALKLYCGLYEKISINNSLHSFIRDEKNSVDVLSSIFNIDAFSDLEGKRYCYVFFIGEFEHNGLNALMFKIGKTRDIKKTFEESKLKYNTDVKIISLYKSANVNILENNLKQYTKENELVSSVSIKGIRHRNLFSSNPTFPIDRIINDFDAFSSL